MKLVVSGSRTVEYGTWEHHLLRATLGTVWGMAYRQGAAHLEVVDGWSPGGGVDELTHEWATEPHIHVPVFSTRVPIGPDEHPLERNTRMINYEHFDADVFLAFNKGGTKGTADSLRKMRAVRATRKLRGLLLPEIIEVNIA